MANLNSESYHFLIGFVTLEYLAFLKLHVIPRFTGTGTGILPVPVNRNRGILTSLVLVCPTALLTQYTYTTLFEILSGPFLRIFPWGEAFFEKGFLSTLPDHKIWGGGHVPPCHPPPPADTPMGNHLSKHWKSRILPQQCFLRLGVWPRL